MSGPDRATWCFADVSPAVFFIEFELVRIGIDRGAQELVDFACGRLFALLGILYLLGVMDAVTQG